MKISMILLAVWLILTGLIMAFALSFQGMMVIMGVLAIASGVLMLLKK